MSSSQVYSATQVIAMAAPTAAAPTKKANPFTAKLSDNKATMKASIQTSTESGKKQVEKNVGAFLVSSNKIMNGATRMPLKEAQTPEEVAQQLVLAKMQAANARHMLEMGVAHSERTAINKAELAAERRRQQLLQQQQVAKPQ